MIGSTGGTMMAERHTWEELEALREPWEATFGEPMGFGFEIGPEQVPMMCECIRTRNKAPLKAYVAAIPAGVVY